MRHCVLQILLSSIRPFLLCFLDCFLLVRMARSEDERVIDHGRFVFSRRSYNTTRPAPRSALTLFIQTKDGASTTERGGHTIKIRYIVATPHQYHRLMKQTPQQGQAQDQVQVQVSSPTPSSSSSPRPTPSPGPRAEVHVEVEFAVEQVGATLGDGSQIQPHEGIPNPTTGRDTDTKRKPRGMDIKSNHGVDVKSCPNLTRFYCSTAF